MTTKRSYEDQLSMMSDHLCSMNETLTKQREEIDTLKMTSKVSCQVLTLDAGCSWELCVYLCHGCSNTLSQIDPQAVVSILGQLERKLQVWSCTLSCALTLVAATWFLAIFFLLCFISIV